MSAILTVKPKIPKVKLAAVDVLAYRLQSILSRFAEGVCADNIGAITRDIVSLLNDDSVPVSHIQSTLLQYSGGALTVRQLNTIARQLAARREKLLFGPLPVLGELVVSEWVAFEVVDAKPAPWKEAELGHAMQLYALTGHAAGSIFTKKFPDTWLAGLAYRAGFSRRLKYPYDGTLFSGLRFWGLTKPSERDPKQPDIEDIKVDAKLKKYNQSIIKKRLRFDVPALATKECCPFNLEHYCLDCDKSSSACDGAFKRTIHVSG